MNRATSPTGWARNPDGTPGWTWNPITGCENHTPEGLCLGGLFPCYAWKLAHGRLKPRYRQNFNIALPHETPREAFNDPFYPRFWEERLFHSWTEKPKGIFVCDMGELFGDWIPREWQEKIINLIRSHRENRYYLLTKQPQNLIKFSPFPENCWVGVTATNTSMAWIASKQLSQIEARVKFLSLEPLLERIDILPLIGYNTDYEGKEQRGNSLSSSAYGGIGDRYKGENLESQGSNIRQVEGGESNYQVSETQDGERHREISPSEGNDKQGEILRPSQQASVVSLQWSNPKGVNREPQERQREGQSPREFGAIDLQPTDKTLNRGSGKNLQERQPWPFSWVIIGACTGTEKDMLQLYNRYPELTIMRLENGVYSLQPRIEWVREIVQAADRAGIRVFQKDNLKPLLGNNLRQETPK